MRTTKNKVWPELVEKIYRKFKICPYLEVLFNSSNLNNKDTWWVENDKFFDLVKRLGYTTHIGGSIFDVVLIYHPFDLKNDDYVKLIKTKLKIKKLSKKIEKFILKEINKKMRF